MSHIICCDGCGHQSTDPKDFKLLGIANKKEYCQSCAPHVEDYLKALDELQEKHHKQWKKDLASLRKKYKKELKCECLPDGD